MHLLQSVSAGEQDASPIRKRRLAERARRRAQILPHVGCGRSARESLQKIVIFDDAVDYLLRNGAKASMESSATFLGRGLSPAGRFLSVSTTEVLRAMVYH